MALQRGGYEEARLLCLKEIEHGGDRLTWLTQLAYLHFLDESNIAVYFSSPNAFNTVREAFPGDRNGKFWYGYSLIVVTGEMAVGEENILSVLSEEPSHPYANLVQASLVTNNQQRVQHLLRCLAVQPNNYRALYEAAKAYIVLGALGDAQAALRLILTNEPFTETGFGIMNDYINGPLTNARIREKVRLDAQRLMGATASQSSAG